MLGLVSKSLAAVRKEPNETTEMVNQLLFGEQVAILESYKQWYRIESTIDSYPGWVDSRLIETVNDSKVVKELSTFTTASTLIQAIKISDSTRYLLSPGSILYGLNGKRFQLNGVDFEITGDVPSPNASTASTVINTAYQFLNTPYLWGGKSIFGIDCSGLIQICFRTANVFLPRDAWQQAQCGQTVEFINHARTGDVAFFDNEEGHITHAGILISSNEIIHSSGYVRTDQFDHQGIYNQQLGAYTHRMRIIKRIL